MDESVNIDRDHNGRAPSTKARFYVGVLWLESLPPNWRDTLDDDALQGLPYAYCIHDKDYDDGDPQELRKAHVHLLFAYGNTTTYKQALSIFKRIGPDAINTCEAVFNVRQKYEYLIHNTKRCEELRLQDDLAGRKHRKHLYDRSERVLGNGFDIGFYEQISSEEKQEYIKEMGKYMIQNNIYDYSAAFSFFSNDPDPQKLQIFLGHSAHFERLCKGIYLSASRHGAAPPPIRVQLVTKPKNRPVFE